MAQCKKPVGKGTVCYPCVVPDNHDGPCMSNENEPSKRARAAWLLAVEAEESTDTPTPAVVAQEAPVQRQVPHPGAEDLSAFQGKARTSATGLMEHEEDGIASPTPLTTVDTNAPGQGRTIRGSRPRTIWAGETVEVNPAPSPFDELESVSACSVCGVPDHSNRWQHSILEAPHVPEPTKTRPGDQPLPVVTEGVFIQDLVIEDVEARKAVGIERYGTPLQANNGRNVDQDLYEELLDATTYLRQKLVERQDLNDAVVGLTRFLEANWHDLPAEAWEFLDVLYAGTKSG